MFLSIKNQKMLSMVKFIPKCFNYLWNQGRISGCWLDFIRRRLETTMITLSRYMVGSKARAQPLTSVELLQLLHFHTTDMVYLVHPSGIQTFNPQISSTATLHLSTRLNWIRQKKRAGPLPNTQLSRSHHNASSNFSHYLVKGRYVCYL